MQALSENHQPEEIMNSLDQLASDFSKDQNKDLVAIDGLFSFEVTDKILKHNEEVRRLAKIDFDFKVFDPDGLKKWYYDKKHHMFLPVFSVINIKKRNLSFTFEHSCNIRMNNTVSYSTNITREDWSHSPISKIYEIILSKNKLPIQIGNLLKYSSATFLCICVATLIITSFINVAIPIAPKLVFTSIFSIAPILSIVFVFLMQKYKYWFSDDISVKYDISTNFGGIVPDSTRQIIKDNMSRFDDIFVISDAQDRWDVEGVAVMIKPKVDPIVVGYKKDTRMFFLLDKFDLTPTEEYLAREFAVKAKQ